MSTQKRLVFCILFLNDFNSSHLKGVDEKNFLDFVEACYRFTPRIAIRPKEAVFLDRTGCEKLFSESGWVARVRALLKRFGMDTRGAAQVSFGSASDAPTALAMARFQKFQKFQGFQGFDALHELSESHELRDNQGAPENLGRKENLPIEALLDYAGPFGLDEEITHNINEMIFCLKKLGLKAVGDFLRLPASSLASRFGKVAVQVHASIEGGWETPWPLFTPASKWIEKVDLEDEVMDLDALFFIVKVHLDRWMARLKGIGKRVSKLSLELSSSSRNPPYSQGVSFMQDRSNRSRKWVIELPFPQGSVLGLIPILKERIGFDLARYPLKAPVERFTVEILEMVPGGAAQRDFLNQKEEDHENWNSLLGRLVSKLGKDNVFMAQPVERYLPEEAWSKVPHVKMAMLEEKSSLNPIPWGGARPSRILKKPTSLRWDGKTLIPFGQASHFKVWKVIQWEGPERLKGEWWRDHEGWGFYRDYYRVITEEGDQLWVFLDKSREVSAFYLHGYFD